MIRTEIKGQILEVSTPFTIGEGDRAVLKQTIVIKQNAELDEWSGREFPQDTWEIDIIGQDEIKRHGLSKDHEVLFFGTFKIQINSKPVAKKITDPKADPKKPAEIMYIPNIRLGSVDLTKS